MRREKNLGVPPDELDDNDVIAKVVASRGNSFDIEVPASQFDRVKRLVPDAEEGARLLVQMSPKMRNRFFVRRGGLVLVAIEEKGKIKGEIVNLVADRRHWERQHYWPPEYIAARQTEAMGLPPTYADEEQGASEDHDVA